MKDRLPKGFVCTKCGCPILFHVWVYAHWREELFHSCLECDRQHLFISGSVFTYKAGKRRQAELFYEDGEVKHGQQIQDPQ